MSDPPMADPRADFDARVKTAIYRWIADTTKSPAAAEIAGVLVAWYDTRLTPQARRPKPDEMRRIFAGIGLEGPFWDPEFDQFG